MQVVTPWYLGTLGLVAEGTEQVVEGYPGCRAKSLQYPGYPGTGYPGTGYPASVPTEGHGHNTIP
eukprot:646847-Rhodomonas_salina.5